jgi:hypothetical protein
LKPRRACLQVRLAMVPAMEKGLFNGNVGHGDLILRMRLRSMRDFAKLKG